MKKVFDVFLDWHQVFLFGQIRGALCQSKPWVLQHWLWGQSPCASWLQSYDFHPCNQVTLSPLWRSLAHDIGSQIMNILVFMEDGKIKIGEYTNLIVFWSLLLGFGFLPLADHRGRWQTLLFSLSFITSAKRFVIGINECDCILLWFVLRLGEENSFDWNLKTWIRTREKHSWGAGLFSRAHRTFRPYRGDGYIRLYSFWDELKGIRNKFKSYKSISGK